VLSGVYFILMVLYMYSGGGGRQTYVKGLVASVFRISYSLYYLYNAISCVAVILRYLILSYVGII
jgi:hypothetical protein